jgi:citrate lyase beta subunit
MEKALRLPTDAVILDLEDGVPPGEKETARTQIAAVLEHPAPGPARYVRLQAATGPEVEADLAAAVRPATDGICLPKVRRPEEIAALEEPLRQREAAAGLPDGRIRLFVLIETALALTQAAAIAAGSPRLAALMLGAEDLAADMGLWSVLPDEELSYARSVVAVAAASRGLQAVDRVFPDFRDAEGLRQDALRARRMGFTGKAIIHPAQIEPVRAVFAPMPEEIERARRIVEAFDAAGGGAIAVDGKMVDRPIVEQARKVLESASDTP